ncbi:MAG: YgiT-type zinc finger protein [Bacteroidetes bacterium]|nr:MAG: YgiT-type zinc finger protein [Bacteroidota bacterium]
MDECLICGSKHFTEQKVNKVYEIDGSPVIVQNIPAHVCNNCGEKYFEGETHDKIMKMVYSNEIATETVEAKSYEFMVE